MQNYQLLNDIDFLQKVESCEIPGDAFDHKAHIRLACLYYWQYGFDKGLHKVAESIRRLAKSLGATDKYHATVTYASYRLTCEALQQMPGAKEWQAVQHLFETSDVISETQIKRYYSDFLLSTDAAKQRWLMPDITPFRNVADVYSPDFEWIEGRVPLLISMPHNGTCLPVEVASNMSDEAQKVKDTDWYLRVLYNFALENGCYLISPLYSRYLIDLNRPSDGAELYPGANNTELCPTTAFDLQPLYLNGKQPDASEIERRTHQYWEPYHNKLSQTMAAMEQRFGGAVLLEAHSIASRVPRFFEGQLPDFNFGTNLGQSCDSIITERLKTFDTKGYTKVINGRFKGGYITRQYANPAYNRHTVQLELSQATYMDEQTLGYDQTKADQVIPVLQEMVESLINVSNELSIAKTR